MSTSSHGLIRSYSSSSSILLGETPPAPSRGLARNHHSVSCLSGNRVNSSHSSGNSAPPPLQSGHDYSAGGAPSERSVIKRRKKPLMHKRSLSNPLANIVLNHHEADEEHDRTHHEPAHADHTHHHAHYSTAASTQDYGEPSLSRYHYRSPSPPSRAGSQPSIHCNNVGGSPQPQLRSHHHPQMKRVAATTPAFSQSVSNDQLVSASGSETALYRQNTWQSDVSGIDNDIGSKDGLSITPRCNSMAGMIRPRSSNAQDVRLTDMTSSSMVDLPVGGYDGSIEHLSQDEVYTLPNSSGKSRSVPRLTLMTVTSDNERGKETAVLCFLFSSFSK